MIRRILDRIADRLGYVRRPANVRSFRPRVVMEADMLARRVKAGS